MKARDIFTASMWAFFGALGTMIANDSFSLDKAGFMYGSGVFLGSLLGMWHIRIRQR